MPCPRCQGLIVNDGEEMRCINCGHRTVVHRQAPAKEREGEGRMAIGGTCTKKNCGESAAEDSVQCEKHRDQTRANNEKFQGKAGPPPRTVSRLNSKAAAQGGGMPFDVRPMPQAVHRPVASTSAALDALDDAIVKIKADMQALERSREILLG